MSVKDEYSAPEWDKATRVHDWRNHVGERTKKIWDTLSYEQKDAIAKDAEDEADNENWD